MFIVVRGDDTGQDKKVLYGKQRLQSTNKNAAILTLSQIYNFVNNCIDN